jgi:type VI secretion system secreted protein VgrG
MRVTVKADVGKLHLRSRELEYLEVRQELGSHHFCTMSFYRDTDDRTQIADLHARRVSIMLEDESDSVVVFEGQVISGTQHYLPYGGAMFTLEAASPSYDLEQHARTRYYNAHTLADLARTLGAQVVGDADSEQHDYVQFGESDFRFLWRAADDAGCMVRPSSPGSQKPLEVRTGFADKTWTLDWGVNLTSLAAHCRAVNHGYKGAAVEATTKTAYRFFGVREDPAFTGGASAVVKAVRDVSGQVAGGGEPNVEVFGARAATTSAFNSLLSRESARAIGAAALLEGSSSAIGLRAGDRVNIRATADWAKPVTGELGLVRVVHRFDGDQYVNEFAATPWSTYTNAKRPPCPTVAGCLTATVVDNRDPEKIGRVQVKYRWQDEGQRTAWVRTIAPYAGNDRGMQFLPEIGDEVAIAFDRGDPERPFVLGALWSTAATPPADNPNIKSIVTRSGNTVRLDDTAGKEVVEVYSATGTCLIRLDNKARTLTVHSEGDLALEAPNGQIRLVCKELLEAVSGDAAADVKGSATVKTGQKLTLAAGSDLAAGAAMSATITGGTTLEASGGAIAKLIGAMVHLNPPGGSASSVHASVPSAKDSAWQKSAVPAEKRFTDAQNTPQSAGR